MADHLGITTPYFGILVSLIPYICLLYTSDAADE